MKYTTMAVPFVFLGVTFTSLTPIVAGPIVAGSIDAGSIGTGVAEARQNLRVFSFGGAVKNDECMIVNGSFGVDSGATPPGPRIRLGSCDDDYALDVEFQIYSEDVYRLFLTDSNGDSGCMSHWNNDWLAANVCVESPGSNHLWDLEIDGERIDGTLKSSNGRCVEYFPDSDTAESLRMVDCNVVTTTFAMVDAPYDCSVDFPSKPIDNFQLKTVGVSTTNLNLENRPSPVRSFVEKDALTVQLFYEGHPNYAADTNYIDVTLYTVDEDAETEGPCNDGNAAALINNEGSAFYTVSPLVPYSNYNKDYNAASVDQCFPHSTNGVVMQAEIVMEGNPFDTTAGDLSLASKIYDTDTDLGLEEGQDGRLQFCARIAYYIGDDDAKELISYLDTKVILDVSLSGEIKFTQSVDISSSDQTVNTVSQDVSTAIEVDSFLCGDPEENGGAPYAEDYSLGQAFRVCVDVKTDDQDKFRLSNFKEVTCSPESTELESNTIVSLVNDEATAASILTTLFDNEETEGAKSFDSATVASGRAISFSTVLTNAYFAGDADTLTCAGSVDVETLSTISVASGQELCDTYLSDMIEQGVDMSAYLALHYIETYQVCCWSTSVDVCDAAWETYNCDPLGDLWVQMVYPGVCSVAEALNQEPGQDSRRHLVSFTVPNPVASSSRRRMDEETGAAVAGATAGFGAIIKLSSSSSSSSLFTASGPFPLWATTTLVGALIAGLVSLI